MLPDYSQRPGESKEQYLKRLQALKKISDLERFRFYCKIPDCDGQPHALDERDPHPHKHARWNQRPSKDKFVTAWITGRGFGKTRSGAEAVKDRLMRYKNHRVAIICPTFAVARDVAIEGESGLLSVLPPEVQSKVKWNRSTGELFMPNGSQVKCFGADKTTDAEAIRGYQTHTVWFEELATIRHAQLAWDMALYANRLKNPTPKILVTTTPKPVPLVRYLLDSPDCQVITGSIFDNAPNLAETTLAILKDQYEGTRLGRQELYGELLEDIPGSLWTSKLIDSSRHNGEVPELRRVIVAIDPAGSHRKDSDETGIVVAGIDDDGEIYVLADLSGQLSPQQWAFRAINAFTDHQADRIVAETNYGGDLVESNLRAVDPAIPFKKLTASRGKALRAEPVVALYEQQRVHHVGILPELEQQMCSYVPGVTGKSPDRMDALVWAVTELAIRKRPNRARVTGFSVV